MQDCLFYSTSFFHYIMINSNLKIVINHLTKKEKKIQFHRAQLKTRRKNLLVVRWNAARELYFLDDDTDDKYSRWMKSTTTATLTR